MITSCISVLLIICFVRCEYWKGKINNKDPKRNSVAFGIFMNHPKNECERGEEYLGISLWK